MCCVLDTTTYLKYYVVNNYMIYFGETSFETNLFFRQ